MSLYWNLLGISIPSYGTCIMLGVLLANLIVVATIRRTTLNMDFFILLECYAVLGGILGSKLLYFTIALIMSLYF